MLKIFLISSLIVLSLCTGLLERPRTSTERLVVPPAGGANAPFSSFCFNASVSGFILKATCNDSNGNGRNASINFGNCIKNYDGNLSQFTGGSTELYTRNCSTDGFSLRCDCQQPTGGYSSCSISLDTIFSSNNGQLTC